MGMTSHINPIRVILQPENSSVCGQACVAMVLGITLDESIALFKSRGQTRTKKLLAVLRSQNIQCGNKLERVVPGSEPPSRCIVKILWTGKKKPPGHWMLRWDGSLYDPILGKDPSFYRVYTDMYRMTSFLRIS